MQIQGSCKGSSDQFANKSSPDSNTSQCIIVYFASFLRRPVFTAMCCQRARSRSFGAKFVYVSRWLHIAVKTGCPQRPAVTAMWIQWIYIGVKVGLWG